LCAVVVFVGWAVLISGFQGQAPQSQATVAAVAAAHPEIDRCDEVTRGAIVDYAAQRLNVGRPAPVWGRKSRNAQGTDLNTDALTFKRSDGRFEIYDVLSGAPPCGAQWDGDGHAFAPGENGFWVPPQLGPEPGGHVPPPAPMTTGDTITRAEFNDALGKMRDEIDALRKEVFNANADLTRLQVKVAGLRNFDPMAAAELIDQTIATYEVNGKTEVDRLGLQHKVKLGLTKRKLP
jgi:hypothetical protein